MLLPMLPTCFVVVCHTVTSRLELHVVLLIYFGLLCCDKLPGEVKVHIICHL